MGYLPLRRRRELGSRRVHVAWALLALSHGVVGCADLLDVPSRPRLVEPSVEMASARSMEPSLEVSVEDAPDGGKSSFGGEPTTPRGDGPAVPRLSDVENPSTPEGRTDGDAVTADAGSLSFDSDAATTAGRCGPSEDLGPNGNCYATVATLLSWDDARVNCRARGDGWDLAAILSESSDRFLAGRVTSEVWIGASDAETEGLWTWVSNGVPFWNGSGLTGRALNGAYENWNSDEPNGGGNSDCARLAPSGGNAWADLECFELRGSICEGPAL